MKFCTYEVVLDKIDVRSFFDNSIELFVESKYSKGSGSRLSVAIRVTDESGMP